LLKKHSHSLGNKVLFSKAKILQSVVIHLHVRVDKKERTVVDLVVIRLFVDRDCWKTIVIGLIPERLGLGPLLDFFRLVGDLSGGQAKSFSLLASTTLARYASYH
jgi:hypothetical protein